MLTETGIISELLTWHKPNCRIFQFTEVTLTKTLISEGALNSTEITSPPVIPLFPYYQLFNKGIRAGREERHHLQQFFLTIFELIIKKYLPLVRNFK